MVLYAITYDLVRPGQSYTNLHAAIMRLGPWIKPLESFWLVRSTLSDAQIRDTLRLHLDANDKLFVLVVGASAAWCLPFASNPPVKAFIEGVPQTAF